MASVELRLRDVGPSLKPLRLLGEEIAIGLRLALRLVELFPERGKLGIELGFQGFHLGDEIVGGKLGHLAQLEVSRMALLMLGEQLLGGRRAPAQRLDLGCGF